MLLVRLTVTRELNCLLLDKLEAHLKSGGKVLKKLCFVWMLVSL